MKVVFEHVPGREWFVVVGVTHEKNDTMNRLEIPEYYYTVRTKKLKVIWI